MQESEGDAIIDLNELYRKYKENPAKFKKIILYRKLLGVPISYNYKKLDLETLIQMVLSIDEEYEDEFHIIMHELGAAYEAIYNNMSKNSAARA